MKKLIVALVMGALLMPAVAMSASQYVNSFQDGTYNGTIKSVIPALNGKTATMEVKHENDKVVATVNYMGGKEVWTWNDTALIQKEVDPKTNSTVQQYGATAANTAKATQQNYKINCTGNKCDAGVDARFNWTLKSTPNSINYVVYGVDKEKMGDATATVKERHTFTFTKK